jgi:uncharacterized damage-inducible protein DinB
MKDHFVKLFSYDRYTNQLIADLIVKAGNPEKPVKLMAHILAAQQIWINRCKALPPADVVLWSDGQPETFTGTITTNSADWLNYLKGLQDSDFEKSISYKNLRGESFENKLVDILGHVINHGTHHRAQIGQHLIAAGVEQLPITDYIFYVRENK